MASSRERTQPCCWCLGLETAPQLSGQTPLRTAFTHAPPDRSSQPLLAGKITLLVGLMGLVSMAIIGYAMVHMRQMDEQYRTLISLESELAQSFGRTGVLLGESQRMVHAAHSASQGTAPPAARSRTAAAHPAAGVRERSSTTLPRACRTRAAD